MLVTVQSTVVALQLRNEGECFFLCKNMAVRFDPLLGKLRMKDVIPQLDSDPASPKQQEAWVLKTVVGGGAGAGEAYGLLLSLTQPGDGADITYALKYRTKDNTTVSVALT